MSNEIILKLLHGSNEDYRIGFQLLAKKYKEEILKHPYYCGNYTYTLDKEDLKRLLGDAYKGCGLVFTDENLDL